MRKSALFTSAPVTGQALDQLGAPCSALAANDAEVTHG